MTTVRLLAMGCNKFKSPDFAQLKFAEKDCVDIVDFFCSADGLVSDAEQHVAQLIGPQLRTDAAKRTLRAFASATDEHDLLIVFFAGHGLVGDKSDDPVLVTHDLEPELVHELGDEGLRLSFLTDYVFGRCAGQSLLILDCCYAGAYAALESGRDCEAGPEAFLGAAQVKSGRMKRHTAFLSCGPESVSLEDPSRQNGRFTARLLDGLRGGARMADAAEITANSLFAYLENVSTDQPPVLGGANPGRLVLARPQVISSSATGTHRRADDARWDVRVLANPLDHCMQLIDELRDLVPPGFRGGPETASDLARALFGADTRLESYQPSTPRGSVAAQRSTEPLALLSGEMLRGGWRSSNGWRVEPGDGVRRAATPVTVVMNEYHGAGSFDAMVTHDLPQRWNDDAGAVLAAHAMAAACRSGASKENLIDAAIDGLRTTYGRVPSTLYGERFASFQSELRSTTMYFQPIVRLAKLAEAVTIDGWEALARDPESNRAPEALFDTAEEWGPRFLVELDLTLARRAIELYLAAHGRANLGAVDLKKLSVNVYPECIVNDAYMAGLEALLKSTRFPATLLILEISEKRPLPRPTFAGRGESATRAFGDLLERITDDLGVSFAIDDFGVGHASLDRLSKLKLAHIKIDRAVLDHDDALEEIRMVVGITRRLTRSGNKPTIVVEGYDRRAEARIPLQQLHDRARVGHIQGHLIEMARPELHGLDEGNRKVIAGLVAGDQAFDVDQLRLRPSE